ncbi:hypothetical protein CBR_g17592 [Chara braunii]|uniref:Tetratricopeptide repeat protein 5 OB fold domain-containing protein n=1 Tax=Chara braunii TaxID=69332 RepID=A0A388KUY8_CHABU|nr:hypothetical protein CBR_g17592 [Chara braunii]|eukprot:GBG73880.1 hypothetical protein CBR_g17592 [Chara braunii]
MDIAAADPRLADIVSKLNELYGTRDTFFPADLSIKKEKLDAGTKEILRALEIVLEENSDNPPRRGYCAYLRGKALNVTPDYCKEAEDNLSKAVKLDPALSDAWVCLGNCFWKKNDLASARNCTPEEVELVKSSVQHAKDAVSLDVKDGNSWYTLGNAYLTQFFSEGSADIGKLKQSLKAYQIAERDPAACSNPDLHFNSAVVYRYFEDYEKALKGFAAAAARDPTLHAEEQIEKIVRLLARLEELASTKLLLDDSHAMVRTLSEGVNKGVAVIGKVLLAVPAEDSVPLCFVLVDADGTCFILSVYSVRDGVIKDGGSCVTLLDPFFQKVFVRWEDKVYAYDGMRLDSPSQLLIGGKQLRSRDIARSTLQTENIPP